MRIRLTNGITYTRDQVRLMFPSQVKTVEKSIIPEDIKLFKTWLNGNDRN